MRSRLGLMVLLSLTAVPWSAQASPFVIDFESLAELDSVANTYPGLTFLNATVLTAGSSLNEFEFPPRSGSNAVFDDGGPLTISFATPVLTVGAYFTYFSGLTFEAFDSASVSLGVISAAFMNNLQLSGEPGSAPNEFIGLTSAVGISHVTIVGGLGGGSFVMDDLTVDALAPPPVPEPGTLILVLAVGAGYARVRRRRSKPAVMHGYEQAHPTR
jgi:hypothetical protein